MTDNVKVDGITINDDTSNICVDGVPAEVCVDGVLAYDVLPPPIVTCPANQSLTELVAMAAVTATNTGGAIPAGGWSISPALPAGLAFDTNTGQISGTPTTASANATYTITGTNSSGSDNCTLQIEVTAALTAPIVSCPANQSLVNGVAMTAVTPVNTGGAVSLGGWSIAPALPAGLSFDTNTGQVSGTPSAVSANTTYTITGTNGAGSDNCTFDIEVTAGLAAPNISCPSNQSFAQSVAISPIISTNTGGAVPGGGWSISPALPAGLVFNTNTSQITGTPTTVTAAATYTVTATNATGSDNCTFNLEVTAGLAAPNVSCPANQSLSQSVAMTPVSATNSGGAIPAGGWSISPALPAGLSFNTNTGQISGTPSVVSGNTVYTITGTNATGSNNCTFSLEVVAGLAAPIVSCPANQTLIQNTAMTPVTATNTGGAIPAAGWSISPALPAGLSFNTSTGQISGTPTAVTANATYTITGTNATGSDNCTFDLEVGVALPIVSCPANQVLVENVAMTPVSASNTGGAIPGGGWSISPAAPPGLTFNTSTGQLSGTPTTAGSGGTFTITGTNASGSDNCTFTIGIAADPGTVAGLPGSFGMRATSAGTGNTPATLTINAAGTYVLNNADGNFLYPDLSGNWHNGDGDAAAWMVYLDGAAGAFGWSEGGIGFDTWANVTAAFSVQNTGLGGPETWTLYFRPQVDGTGAAPGAGANDVAWTFGAQAD